MSTGESRDLAPPVFTTIAQADHDPIRLPPFSALGMGTFLMMIGAVFNTHPPDKNATEASGASIGMAVLIYLFVIPYCFSWGGLVWVYISELFDTRSRAYGIAFANASQW